MDTNDPLRRTLMGTSQMTMATFTLPGICSLPWLKALQFHNVVYIAAFPVIYLPLHVHTVGYIHTAEVAQEVERWLGNQRVSELDPRLPQSWCQSVPERDTEPVLAPNEQVGASQWC